MVQGKKFKGTDSAAGQRMPTRIYPYLSEDVWLDNREVVTDKIHYYNVKKKAS